MNLNRLIYRHSVLFFVFIAVSAFLGFWPGYLSQIRGHDLVVHIHGVLLSLWLVMLIAQSTLIRINRRELHMQIGKLSYVLAPLVLLSIATIRHNALGRAEDPFVDRELVLLFSNAIAQPLTFAATYLLAIYNRSDPATHARFMLCTLIPSAGPIFNRVMSAYVTDAFVWAPITQNVAVLSLVGLSIWDWTERKRLNVFPVILGLTLALTLANSFFSGSDLQLRFARWYLALPLS